MSDSTPIEKGLACPKIDTYSIVSNLKGCEGVFEASALEVEGKIHAFITPDTVDIQRIERHLESSLDQSLVLPASYHRLPQMPYTNKGAIDEEELVLWLKRSVTENTSTEHLLRPAQIHVREIGSSASSISSVPLSPESPAWKDQYLESQLPEKRLSKPLRNLRYICMIIYRRIFAVIFIANMVPYIYLLLKGTDCPTLATACSINMLISIVIRQENVVNALFYMALLVPRSWPLWIRKNTSKVYHLGGLHSGCGVSATFWFAFLVAEASLDAVKNSTIRPGEKIISTATLAVSYAIMVLLTVMLSFAYPSIRRKMHDQFEQVHRFAGWTVLILFWTLTILLVSDYSGPSIPFAKVLIHTPAFWCLVIITVSIASPWAQLRKVKVTPEKLSNHALRLHFSHRNNPVPGSFVRLSDNPLMEWHSFATIAVPERNGFSVVVSKAGDWTGKYIASPPTEMWIRGVPTRGVMNVAHCFNRVVIVGTGSGIGPCLPVLLSAARNNIQVRVLWSTPKPRETFGDEVVDGVLSADPNAVIWDTRVDGKPDIVKLVWGLVQESQAEAVVIISNPALTKKVVYGMESRGVAAYGAIWDS
ncbi:hypothetical protein H072_1899 [Dactylellina haptotyla CBS 200.50]|uniref:FAD-binding FR-type domain-containing protein n=1 Tax=Dactylellina haptotyla (strain CBS 200.50) TaxID=1284197 RepID=S8AMK4_DACHA|nr:hypothetical protein H072_1899 [Dactylellina haptotyla CBS 200.50]